MKKFWIPAVLGMVLVPSLHASLAPFQQGTGESVYFRNFEDDAGGFYLAWTDEQAGKVVGLCAQHIDPNGRGSWGDTGLCITAHLASAKDWSGLSDGRGGITLFWDERDGVHARRFGTTVALDKPATSILVSTSTALQPDAVADASGGTLVVWKEALPDLQRSVIMAQRIDGEGRPIWTRGGIRVSLRASDQSNPRVVYDNMSGMMVAWRDVANEASELRVQRIDFQGNRLWGLEGIKITAPVGESEFPRMAPLGTGEVVFAWNASADQTNQIFLQKVGPEPLLKWGNMTLASNIPIQYNRWNPLVVGDEKGGTWIAWEDFRNQINYQIQLNHLNGSGKSVWSGGEVQTAPAPGEQGKAAMAPDTSDGVWLAWIDSRLSTVGLYVQEINSAGLRLQGTKGRLVADQLKKPSNPQITPLGNGKAAVSWADKPKKGQWQLFWSIIDTPLPSR